MERLVDSSKINLRKTASNLKFETLDSVNNPRSVHGIYPYRGKIAAVDSARVISQLPTDVTLLDPFCGSGTIVYEAARAGLRSVGVDANPLAVMLTMGKLVMPPSREQARIEVEGILRQARQSGTVTRSVESSRYFHPDTWVEISELVPHFQQMSPYLKACFAGAICLVARGCNWYRWTSSSVGKDFPTKQYINFREKLLGKVLKHYFPLESKTEVHNGDARKLSRILNAGSCDIVFTSPPYFDCLDYTSYYAKIVFDILGWNRTGIREELIQSFRSYEDDMKLVLEELSGVVRPGGLIIFVVGDKKIHGQVINGGDFFRSIAPWKHFRTVERAYSGTSSKVFDSINKTQRREQIVMWIND